MNGLGKQFDRDLNFWDCCDLSSLYQELLDSFLNEIMIHTARCHNDDCPEFTCADGCATKQKTKETLDYESGYADGTVGLPSAGEHSVDYWVGFDAGADSARQSRETECKGRAQ